MTYMKEISLIFPHQLFRHHPALTPCRPVCLVEEWLFFSQYAFHKQKLILHRASMKSYADRLRKDGYQLIYVESTDDRHDIRHLLPALAAEGYTSIHLASPEDDWLGKRMIRAAALSGIRLVEYASPYFLNTREEIDTFFMGRKRYFQTDFYVAQRKQRKLLLDGDGSPAGGKWSFDADNRLRIPQNVIIPSVPHHTSDAYTKEASEYVSRYFRGNPGDLPAPSTAGYPWAWTSEGAEAMLEDFLQSRIRSFGAYEDAMVEKERYLFHSVLSPVLNNGLLTPAHVLERTLAVAHEKQVPLNSLEGFIRQITGWREFIRAVYAREGGRQRTMNYWGFSRKMPKECWTGETGIGPVDAVIRKVLQTGYAHHIERLMVLGNFFLLCEFDPDEVYRWFMEMFIDAYDWVMVPNVYGMTQFSDGGLMTTKPYISGSNYLMKMGDWQRSVVPATGFTWMETWDGLFWRFMHLHRDFFLSNPRLGMLVKTFDRMDEEKRSRHLRIADGYLSTF